MSTCWGWFPVILVILSCHLFSVSTTELSPAPNRTEKFLNIFTLVRFSNYICNATNGSMGECLSSSDCSTQGGSPMGPCAQGFGVCCVFRVTCRNTTKNAVSYFVNEGNPNADNITGPCDLRIDVTDRAVCQIRLDFTEFTLAPPVAADANGYVCTNSKMQIISRQSNTLGVKEFCGENSGQHVYIPVDATSATDSVTLFFTLSQILPSKWNIKITQIKCAGAENRTQIAPPGCLQYFTDRMGAIESFNFNRAMGKYFANQNYAICIQRTPDTCQVRYSVNQPMDFRLAAAMAAGATDNAHCIAASNSTSSPYTGDFLQIPGASDGMLGSATISKICGTPFTATLPVMAPPMVMMGMMPAMTIGTPIFSLSAGPIVLNFRTDGIRMAMGMGVNATDEENGFRINYELVSTGC